LLPNINSSIKYIVDTTDSLWCNSGHNDKILCFLPRYFVICFNIKGIWDLWKILKSKFITQRRICINRKYVFVMTAKVICIFSKRFFPKIQRNDLLKMIHYQFLYMFLIHSNTAINRDSFCSLFSCSLMFWVRRLFPVQKLSFLSMVVSMIDDGEDSNKIFLLVLNYHFNTIFWNVM
jgi:hypothetical protein